MGRYILYFSWFSKIITILAHFYGVPFVPMLAQQSNSVVYAVKIVPKAKVVTHKQIDQILAELKILK